MSLVPEPRERTTESYCVTFWMEKRSCPTPQCLTPPQWNSSTKDTIPPGTRGPSMEDCSTESFTWTSGTNAELCTFFLLFASQSLVMCCLLIFLSQRLRLFWTSNLISFNPTYPHQPLPPPPHTHTN